MGRVALRASAAAFAAALLASGHAGPEQAPMVLVAPGRAFIGQLEVACSAGGGTMMITVANTGDRPVTARVTVRPTIIGGTASVERRQTGWRDVVVCEGDSCRIERQAVYELFDAVDPVSARVSVSPDRIEIPAGGEGRFTVILLNAEASNAPFELAARLRTVSGAEVLEIDCPSTALLDEG